MSVRTMARVWEKSQHCGSALLMLLAIADFADDDGQAFPSVSRLAKKCRIKPRNCQYILRALEKSGELVIKFNKGPSGSNLYQIVLGALGVQSGAGAQGIAGVQQIARRGATHCMETVQSIAYKPSVNRQQPSSRTREKKKPSRFDANTYLLSLGVDEQIVNDWLDHRKTKRAEPSKTAIDGILREAKEAGITLSDALAISCERGWTGFKAEWMADKQNDVSDKFPPGNKNLFGGAI